MEVSFQLVEDDYVAYTDYWYQKTAAGKRALRRAYGLGMALFVVYAWMERDHVQYGWHHPVAYAVYMVLSALVLGGIYASFLWYIRPTLARMAVRMGPRASILLPCTVRIEREAMHVRTSKGAGRLPWTQVEDIGSTWDHLFVIVRGAGGFIIPKRAFTSTEAYNIYYAAMMRHFNDAHRPAGAPASALPGA